MLCSLLALKTKSGWFGSYCHEVMAALKRTSQEEGQGDDDRDLLVVPGKRRRANPEPEDTARHLSFLYVFIFCVCSAGFIHFMHFICFTSKCSFIFCAVLVPEIPRMTLLSTWNLFFKKW